MKRFLWRLWFCARYIGRKYDNVPPTFRYGPSLAWELSGIMWPADWPEEGEYD